jgi:putative FmdB family regulatory protein
MPTYEYGCSACGRQWEEVQRITAAPTEICPACGKAAAHRLISAGTGFILKGGGWYSDLYSSAKPAVKGGGEVANGASKDGADKESGAKKDAPASTEGSSTKSEPKAASPTPAAPASAGS